MRLDLMHLEYLLGPNRNYLKHCFWSSRFFQVAFLEGVSKIHTKMIIDVCNLPSHIPIYKTPSLKGLASRLQHAHQSSRLPQQQLVLCCLQFFINLIFINIRKYRGSVNFNTDLTLISCR